MPGIKYEIASKNGTLSMSAGGNCMWLGSFPLPAESQNIQIEQGD